MCLDRRQCVEPWRGAVLVAPGSYNIHPGTCHSLWCSSGTPSRLQADWSHVSSSRDGTATVVRREPHEGPAIARFRGAKSSPFSAIAGLIRPSLNRQTGGPWRTGSRNVRAGAAMRKSRRLQRCPADLRAAEFQMRPTT